MSKTINVCLHFYSILLNQLMTSDVSFHWFKLALFLSLLFILSRMGLLNLPISFFVGLISLIFGLFVKFGLWSFRDMKHSPWWFTRILFTIVLSFTMSFPSKLIRFSMFLFTFLYVVVIESFINLLYSSFSSLYRFVVLSANVSFLLSLLISCMSSFSFLWNSINWIARFQMQKVLKFVAANLNFSNDSFPGFHLLLFPYSRNALSTLFFL